MKTISQFIKDVQEKIGVKKDVEFAKLLGIKQPSLFALKNGITHPSEETCRKLAELAKEPYVKVLIMAQTEKASPEAKPEWGGLFDTLEKTGVFRKIAKGGRAAAFGFFVLAASTMLNSVNVGAASPSVNSNGAYVGYYVKLRRLLWHKLSTLLKFQLSFHPVPA